MSPAWAIPGVFPLEEPELELDVPDDDPLEEPDPELDVEPEVEPEVEPDVEPEVDPELELSMEPEVEPDAEPDVDPEDPLDVDPETAPLDELVEPAAPDDPLDPEVVPSSGSPLPDFDVPHAATAATIPRKNRLREWKCITPPRRETVPQVSRQRDGSLAAAPLHRSGACGSVPSKKLRSTGFGQPY
jgi:hypothetical protein